MRSMNLTFASTSQMLYSQECYWSLHITSQVLYAQESFHLLTLLTVHHTCHYNRLELLTQLPAAAHHARHHNPSVVVLLRVAPLTSLRFLLPLTTLLPPPSHRYPPQPQSFMDPQSSSCFSTHAPHAHSS